MGSTVQVGRDLDIYIVSSNSAAMTSFLTHEFGSGAKIGLVNTLSVTIDHDVQIYRGAGRRHGWGSRAGAYDVTAHLEGLWIDSGAQGFFTSQALATGALRGFSLGCSGTEQGYVFSGCRMGTYELSFDAEGWATNTIDVTALTMK